jgi:hypothetical protein
VESDSACGTHASSAYVTSEPLTRTAFSPAALSIGTSENGRDRPGARLRSEQNPFGLSVEIHAHAHQEAPGGDWAEDTFRDAQPIVAITRKRLRNS